MRARITKANDRRVSQCRPDTSRCPNTNVGKLMQQDLVTVVVCKIAPCFW
jgi:hypothetical protein